jgi:dipeptide/tripeptide permease
MKSSAFIRFAAAVVVAACLYLSLHFDAWIGLGSCLVLAWAIWITKPWVRLPEVNPRTKRRMVYCFIAPLMIFAFVTIFFPLFSAADWVSKINKHR